MELTEFEKKLKFLCSAFQHVDSSYDDVINGVIQDYAKDLLDLSRKELQPEFDKEMDKMLAETDKVIYQKGQQDALKSLPKLEKTKGLYYPTIPIMYTHTPSMKSYVEYHGYKLCINDVFEKLPKEE